MYFIGAIQTYPFLKASYCINDGGGVSIFIPLYLDIIDKKHNYKV